MELLKLYRFLKEYKKLKKLNTKIYQVGDYVRNYHIEYVKKYPNLAIFAFDGIGLDISFFGIFDKKSLRGLEDCIFKKIDTQNSVCIDIGANIGNHTLYFAQFFNKVYSFEPHPEIFELLKFNIRKSNNVKVFKLGVSNINDEMIITTNEPTEYGASSLQKKTSLKPANDKNIFDVQVKKFDDFFNNINEENNISFIKLDIESHELYALQGMKKVLKKYSPIICLEQNKIEFNYYGNELSSKSINFLKDNGYSFFYEILYERQWRYFNNSNLFLKNIVKLFEAILFGVPEKINRLKMINEFSRKRINQNYQALIASKVQLV